MAESLCIYPRIIEAHYFTLTTYKVRKVLSQALRLAKLTRPQGLPSLSLTQLELL